jgi:hypothetical protein
MAEDLQLTGKAQRTVHGYLRAVRQLADHCRKAPDTISESDLRRYFLHFKNQRQAAYGTLRVALSGIQFFYRTTCPRDWNVLDMLKLKNDLGHSSLMTTIEYLHLTDAAAADARGTASRSGPLMPDGFGRGGIAPTRGEVS